MIVLSSKVSHTYFGNVKILKFKKHHMQMRGFRKGAPERINKFEDADMQAMFSRETDETARPSLRGLYGASAQGVM